MTLCFLGLLLFSNRHGNQSDQILQFARAKGFQRHGAYSAQTGISCSLEHLSSILRVFRSFGQIHMPGRSKVESHFLPRLQ